MNVDNQGARAPVLRIGLFGLFGVGNLGNEGSLTSVVAHLRRTRPEATLQCLCGDPEATAARHGVASTRFTLTSGPIRPGMRGMITKVVRRVADVPRLYRLVGQLDTVVVPGMGVLEEQIGAKPWGLPYWLVILAASCRLRGTTLALVSVGSDEVRNPLTKRMYRFVAQSATYRSFRDEFSWRCARELGVRGDPGPVLPDVAFGLELGPGQPPRPSTVGVGVMRYYGAHDDPERGIDLRRSYLDAMTRFITTLVQEGRDVRLLVGDDVDLDTAYALADAVRVRMPELPSSALVVCNADDLVQLVDEMSGCGVIVASRYHNVICGLLSQRPVVSVAYGPKNTALMEWVGLGDFCQDIDALDVDRLLEQLRSVEGQWPGLQPLLEEYLRSFREQTDDQLRRLANAMPQLDLDPTPDGRISQRFGQD